MSVDTRTWGRAWHASLTSIISCLALLTLSPLLVAYFFISAFFYNCSLVAPLKALYTGEVTVPHLISLIPLPTMGTFTIVAIWLALQLLLAFTPDLLHRVIPSYQGGMCKGAITPAGNQHLYNINGMQTWVVSHGLFLMGAFWFGWFSPTLIFDNWGGIFWIANILGTLLAVFVFAKAYLFPSFGDDRKFSGSIIYDFFMGIELNPRIKSLDIKLFFNGRPGIVAWTLINISFAAAQYARFGHVTNSMLLVNLFQILYVVYFFWKEAWYLKTIDIHHDHFGWMLAWGDCVWLPYMYTLQALFLVFNPVELSFAYCTLVLIIGLGGFYIFASANNQKDRFRGSNGKNAIWNKQPQYITCSYLTLDGTKRETKLLLSGWWGISRHMNYTGDLLLSLAYSLACGMDFLFPYFYFIFLSILLIHRCIRDEKRCSDKYGKSWQEYCSRVPYRLVPYIW